MDTVGSAALATVADKGGVSTHIGSEYFLGLPVGDVAVIDATVMHQGNKLCNIEVFIPHSGAIVGLTCYKQANMPDSSVKSSGSVSF